MIVSCQLRHRFEYTRKSAAEERKGHLPNNADINFIQNHPPPRNPRDTIRRGQKPSPGMIIVYKPLPLGQIKELKVPPPEHKVRKFDKYIYQL